MHASEGTADSPAESAAESLDGRATMRATFGRVLVVDDDVANRHLLELLLVQRGFKPVPAASGRAALEAVRRERFDVVLLDVMMPELDGVATCRAIREDLGQPLLPVLLVTALNDAATRTRGLQAGADDFITKPICSDELFARMHALLRVRQTQARLDEERVRARESAMRWQLVAHVADRVARAATREELCQRLADALAPFAPVGDVSIVASCPDGDVPILDDAGAIVVPLCCEDRLGLRVAPAPATPFDIEQIELFLALSAHIQNAFTRVRLGEARLELDGAREQLAALVVHDLKNPLSVLRTNLEFLHRTLRGSLPAAQDALSDAEAAADQMQRMILDLLDIGRAEDGRLPFDPRPGDVGDLVARTTAAWQAAVQHRGARLIIDVGSALSAVDHDEALITRVLQNLLTNAARFAASVVEVTARRSGAEAIISVANDGPTIPSEMCARLFDKYGQVTADQGHANRGLGLYLCRLVAERHGGRITVGERPGGGARFDVALPIRGR